MPTEWSNRLLTFARRLLRVETFAELLDVTREEIQRTTGYQHAWLMVSDEDENVTEVRLINVSGGKAEQTWKVVPTLRIADDKLLEEIFNSDAPVVVVDARTDPRTNKRIVGELGNVTIINVPLRLLDSPFGAFGTGTFGEEGVRAPTPEQLNYLVAMAAQVSVAASRLRYREQQRAASEEREKYQRRIAQIQRLESLGLMAGGVAHDFNNLLTVVLACAQMAQLSEDDPAAVQVELAGIIEAANRGSALTKQLLAMSRSRPLELQSIDFNARMRDLVKLLRRVLPENIEIDLIEHAGEVLIEGDASQLDQAFMNLCINAGEAMPQGGRLTIEIEQVLINGAYVKTHPWAKPGRYILTSVTDTGSGMTPDVVERAFEPFFSTKGEQSGTGLGLAVAYGSVRQHDGMMHCYSEPDVGTTFKVYLPLMARSANDVGTKLDGPVRGGSERLLIAEDDPSVRAVIERILTKAGYSLTVARNGQQAVEAARQEPFDLVVLDVIMPGMSCQQALDQLRELHPNVRVLLSSGYTADTNVAELVRTSKCELLAKPYDPDKLLRMVRAALEK
ncbi:MAG: response regulator [Phycisphaerae bacterium]|nr:response regulator [Gemmatimonadaceae bacterium]